MQSLKLGVELPVLLTGELDLNLKKPAGLWLSN
jgi:hypothetical protein